MATTKATELSQFSSTLTVDSSGNVVLTGSVTASSFLTGGTALLDSSRATALIDSAYVQARQVDLQRDSAFITGIADSAYVQARQDFAYSSLTGAPTALSSFTNDTNYLDSTTVQGVIDATYIQANQTTYDFLDSSEAINLIDSAYVQARQTTYDFLDSSEAINLIDSAYVRARVKTNQNLQTSDNVTFADLVLTGSLQVNGTTTTINSTTLTINDKNIVLADSAANAAAADGAGITINGASATLTYASAGDNWVFNKAPYYSSARLITTDDKLIDSALTTQLIDSAYILARAPEPDGDGLAFAIALG